MYGPFQAPAAAKASAEQAPISAEIQPSGAEALTKRAQAERPYAALSADGAPVSTAQLAAAAGLSNSYARALLAEFQARPPAPSRGTADRRPQGPSLTWKSWRRQRAVSDSSTPHPEASC